MLSEHSHYKLYTHHGS